MEKKGLGEQKPKKTKKTKKTILHGLTQDSSHRIGFFGFFGFFGFLRVFGQVGLGEEKTSRKTKKNKKNNFAWTYPRFFSQNCFFCFFWLSSSFWTSGLGRAKNLEKHKKKPKKQKKNNFAWTYPRFFSQDCFFWFSLSCWTFGKLGMEKKGKNKTCKNPTLPAWLSVFHMFQPPLEDLLTSSPSTATLVQPQPSSLDLLWFQ